MKIVGVKYGALANLGNYENERVELEARLEEGEFLDEVVEKLRNKSLQLLDREDKAQKRYQLERELRATEAKVEAARQQWAEVSAFMTAQGLRADPPEFPNFLNRIAAPVESVEVVEEEETTQTSSGESSRW